ncbi:MAG: hypothetical protein GVY36_17095 [Verrucomicrobia bacterium]|jgi:hypothetical protein|nr:hypothetical protein [Verrucomicrobiota bacterium]
MKKRSKLISIVAHVTIRGLESLKRGRIDLNDPRLDGERGTVQLELHTDRRTARQMEMEIMACRGLFGDEGALQHLDEAYISPSRVKVALVTSGNKETDRYIQDCGKAQGYNVQVATA